MSSSAGFALLAYRAMDTPTLTAPGLVSHAKRNLYVGAALAAFGLVPYTKFLMYADIGQLEVKAREAKAARTGVKGASASADGDKETYELVKKWGTMNFWRGMILLSSAGMGIWACVVDG